MSPGAAAGPRCAPRLPRWRLLALSAAQTLFAGPGPLWLGGGLRLARDHRYHFGFAVDVVAHHGGAPVPLGALSADTVSAGGALRFQHRAGPLRLGAGGGLRAGAARLGGSP